MAKEHCEAADGHVALPTLRVLNDRIATEQNPQHLETQSGKGA